MKGEKLLSSDENKLSFKFNLNIQMRWLSGTDHVPGRVGHLDLPCTGPCSRHFSLAFPPPLFLPFRVLLKPRVLTVATLSLPFLPDQGFCAGSSPTPLSNAINSLKSLASEFIFFPPKSVLHSFKAIRKKRKTFFFPSIKSKKKSSSFACP